MKTRSHPGAAFEFRGRKPSMHHSPGRERRRIVADEGLAHSHSHPEWPSIPTMFERDDLAPREFLAVPHHGALPVTDDVLRLIVEASQLASHLTSVPVVFGIMQALRESLPLGQPHSGQNDEVRRLSARVEGLEERLARLEVLASPQTDQPEIGDPFEGFQDLRKTLGDAKFGWILADD